MAKFSRRKFLQHSALATLTSLPGLRLAWAQSPLARRLLVVILRGAWDGLAAVVPIADPAYAAARGRLALPPAELLPLDSFFAWHPALKDFAQLYQQQELLIFPASATPYRERSHFAGQDVLENGTTNPAENSGWLNRLLTLLPAADGFQQGLAVALGSTLPLLLHGTASVSTWAPSRLPAVNAAFLDRAERLYQKDPLLLNASQAARMLPEVSEENAGRGRQAFVSLMQQAAAFLAPAHGARVASVALSGWDTHNNQGLITGQLANNFTLLNNGLMAFRQGMGEAWQHSTVLMISEFGRTVAANGSGGSDHGTGGLALVAGGGWRKSQVLGDWPGLQNLYQGRDLQPANDLRALLKTLLLEQFAVDKSDLEQIVFPGSQGVWLRQKLWL